MTSFKNFGRVSFVPYTKVSAFADYLKENKLKGTKCKKCGTLFFPPRAECVKCMSEEMDWVDMSGKGKLVTYTVIHAAPTGFENSVPYTIGVVDLAEGGRLLAWMDGIKEDEIKIGMDLKVVPQMLEDVEEEILVYTLRK